MIRKLLPKVFLSVSLYLENGEVELEEKILLKLVRKLKTVDTRKLKYEKVCVTPYLKSRLSGVLFMLFKTCLFIVLRKKLNGIFVIR